MVRQRTVRKIKNLHLGMKKMTRHHSSYIFTPRIWNPPPHSLMISKIITNIARNDIKETKKLSRGKISVELKSATAANNLIQSELLKVQNLRAFIPAFKKIRIGVVKGVPTDLSEKEIKEATESPFQITDIRFN